MKTSHFLKSSVVLSFVLIPLSIGNFGCKASVSISGESVISSSDASNICSGTTLGGVAGTATCTTTLSLLQSNASRNVGTTQLTLAQEVATYAGTTSSNLPSNYREIPDVSIDDDGYYATGANQYGTRPQVACGGTAILTVANKIADCLSKNGAIATWDGSAKGTGGQSVWKLVFSSGQAVAGTCNSAAMATDCYEVWQDQRTGLLWSSATTRYAGAAFDFNRVQCLATGNSQNATIDCSVGGSYQYATTPASSCSESTETGGVQAIVGMCTNNSSYLNSIGCTGTWYNNTLTPTGGQEDYSAGNYSIAKGYMGAKSSTKVRWRLPTKSDYELAEVDGIRFVMPDMGTAGGTNGRASDGTIGSLFNEAMATAYSSSRSLNWYMSASDGRFEPFQDATARCVGR